MPSSPYGFQVADNCVACTFRNDKFFCNLSPDTLEAFERVTFATSYPSGAQLYVEGEDPRGIYLLCQGRAKLTVNSADGKTFITRVATPGDVLGLSSVLSEEKHRATVEALEPVQVKFVKREDFLRFVKDHADACFRASRQLSRESNEFTDHLRSLGLSHSAAEKLANLLLGWIEEKGKPAEHGIRVPISMTHQEIAQLIGTSRETVTRTFADFRQKKILSLRGSMLVVYDKPALESLVLL